MLELPKKTIPGSSRAGYQPIRDDDGSNVTNTAFDVAMNTSDILGVNLKAQSPSSHSSKTGFRNPWVITALAMTTILVLVSIATNSQFLSTGRSPFDAPAPLSIYLDTSKNEYQVIDNDPLITTAKQKYHILASGKYLKNVNGNGWHYLEVETLHMEGWIKSNNVTLAGMSNTTRNHLINEEYIRTMKALGYLEGFVTCHEMNAWYMNFYSGLFDGGDPTEEALEFLESNHDWMVDQAERNYLSNEYWLTVKGLLSQLEGVVAGVKDGCPGVEQTRGENAWTTPTHGPGIFLPSLHKRPAMIHLLLMNANGDLYQIGEKFDQANAPASTVLENYPNDDDYASPADGTNATSDNSGSSSSASTPSDTATASAKVRQSRSTKNRKTVTFQERMEQVATGGKRAMRAKPEFIRRRMTSDNVEKDTTRWTPAKFEGAKQRRLAKEAAATAAKKAATTTTASSSSASAASSPSGSAADGARHLTSLPDDDGVPSHLNPIADRKRLHRHDHCSVLIKVTDNKEDVLFAHNTWDDFQCAAPRVIKNYHYNNYRSRGGKPWSMFNVLFSSSPGLLSSVDDFFLIKGRGRMAVIETSIDVFNNQLLNLVIPESMLSWTRARLANQLAHSGQSWADIFSLFHSGTYVNQWMVLDFKKFTSGMDPQTGFLTVLEEVPGYIHYEDMTEVLVNTSYWASFNNPFFDDVARLTGQYQLCKDNINNCYDHDPRGLIFAREQNKVQTIADMQRMIGFNAFETDPLSLNDSCNAIACRQDLQPNPASRYPFGAIDGKVSSVNHANTNRPVMFTRLGPSPDNGHGPFCWDAFANAFNHRGFAFFHVQHPPCFDFEWEVMPPVEMQPLLTFQVPSTEAPSAPSSGNGNDNGNGNGNTKRGSSGTMRADNTMIRLDQCPEDSGNPL